MWLFIQILAHLQNNIFVAIVSYLWLWLTCPLKLVAQSDTKHTPSGSKTHFSYTKWQFWEKSTQGTDPWVSNLTKEFHSQIHKREMGSSDVIKQGQWRAIYFWNRMESVTGLLMDSTLKVEGGEIPVCKSNSIRTEASSTERPITIHQSFLALILLTLEDQENRKQYILDQ